MMRRPGRRIEIWEVNESTGEYRRPTPTQTARWPWKDSVRHEVEIRLITDPGSWGKPHFRVYGPTCNGKEFDTLEPARDHVEVIAKELVEANAEPWEELIVIGAGTYQYTHSAFGMSFGRVLFSGERARWMKKDGSYDPPKAYKQSRKERLEMVPFDEDLWGALVEASDLTEWVYEKMHGHAKGLYGWGTPDLTEEQTAAARDFAVNYALECAKLVRRMRANEYAKRVRVPVKEEDNG